MPWIEGTWVGEAPTLEELSTEQCECCNCPGVQLHVCLIRNDNKIRDCQRIKRPPYKAICNLCAGSMAGLSDDLFRGQWSVETRAILKTICFVGNEIIKRMK